MKRVRPSPRLITASLALTCLIPQTTVLANDWTAGIGDWSNAANWGGTVPDNTGGWAIGNIGNGGTAWVTTAVPTVSEAWAGNGGVAGTIIVTNGGTLSVANWLVVGRTGGGGNTPLSTLIVDGTGVVNKWGDGFILGDGGNCKGQILVKGSGTVNVTGGWHGIGNGDGEGWLYLQDNATYSMADREFNVGDYGTGRGHAYISGNATLNVGRFWLGKWDNSSGALWQSGGTVNGVNGGNEWCLGGENAAAANVYGFYNLAGGTLTCPYNFQVGRYGKGVMYQSGGTNIQSGWCDTARYAGSTGIAWFSGGLFQHTSLSTRYMVGESGRGEVTVSGTAVLETAAPLMMANGQSYLTLLGGTVLVPQIDRWGGQSYLNFHGGTLKAKASNPAFVVGTINEARVYSGNAIFDSNGYDITVVPPLVAPYGNGVSSIPISDPGAGYIGAPIVEITGDGAGALAVAQVDPVAGTVTNILVTCPGYGYSFALVNLVSGAPTTAAFAGTPVLAAVTSGGVVKQGAGTLTLSGASSYAGPTIINGGMLAVTTASTGGGAYQVANGAALRVVLTGAFTQLAASSATLGGGSAATLEFDLGNYGNPFLAPLNVGGTLSVNGPITINIADGLPQPGQFPLIQYASRAGSGSFLLGTIPVGVQAHLVTNTANPSIDLVITGVGQPRWDGQAGGNWDIGLTTNWIESSTGLPSYYKDGTAVFFDDLALGTTTVNLVTNVAPGSVVANVTNLTYSLIGTGKITGATSFTKQGTNTFTIANAPNSFTGPVRLEGGILAVTNLANGGLPSAIGAASSAPANLVFAGGTLSYAGPAMTLDRGYSTQLGNNNLDLQSDLTLTGVVAPGGGSRFAKSGPATLTYARPGTNELSGGAFPGYNVTAGVLKFDGSAGTQVNHSQNEFWIGSGTAVGASLLLTNTTLNIDNWLSVGRGNGSVGNVSGATLENSTLRSGNFSMGYDAGVAGHLAQQYLTLNGTSAFTNNGDMNLGESGGASANVLLTGTSSLYSGWRVQQGWHTAATGSVTLAQSSRMTINAWYSIGNEGGIGTLTMKDNSRLWVLWDMNVTDVGLGDGTFNLQDNAVALANNYFVGKGVGSSGLVNQTGGSAVGRLNDGNEFQIGFHGAGVWNLSAGSILAPNHWFIVGRWTDGPGILNVTGGAIIHGTNNAGRLFRVGEDGTGTLNLSGTGAIITACDQVTIGWNATGNGTLNLNGGTFQARRIIGGAGASAFNFNGGQLVVGPNPNADFMSALTTATVFGGGAKIDTGAGSIAIAQSLLDGGGNGGLTKTGTGTLALNGFSTYLGPTLINAGTLGGSGTLLSPVTIALGATLAPGASVGVLTINGALTLAAGSTTVMEIDKTAGTSDQVIGLTSVNYGGTLVIKKTTGTLVAGDTFQLFAAGARAGTFASIVSQTPGQTVTWDTSGLAVDGSIKVATAVTTPVNLTLGQTGNTLQLAWPTSQTGWTLQTQANPLSIGISTNWVTVPGSAATNQVTVPVDPAKPAVFYRLVFP